MPRIDPIGPYDRRSMPVSRVQRRERTPDERGEERRREDFEEQLERMKERRERDGAPADDEREPPVTYTPAAGDELPPTPPAVRCRPPEPGDDGRLHIDVSV